MLLELAEALHLGMKEYMRQCIKTWTTMVKVIRRVVFISYGICQSMQFHVALNDLIIASLTMPEIRVISSIEPNRRQA